MNTVKQMIVKSTGEDFSFSYSPDQYQFNNAVIGDTLTGQIGQSDCVGYSLLRHQKQYVTSNYTEISVKVVGEYTVNKYVDKYVRENGELFNRGSSQPFRKLLVEFVH